MAEKEFSGRTALVTGGSRGIGRACALMLAARGASVAVNYRSSADAAQEVVDSVTAAGQRAMAVQADVSDEAQVVSMIETVERELGPVELLINNAGVFHFVSHEDSDLAVWNETLAVNLTGTFLVTWGREAEDDRAGLRTDRQHVLHFGTAGPAEFDRLCGEQSGE